MKQPTKLKITKGEWQQSEFNPQQITTSKDPMAQITICTLHGNTHTDNEIQANAKAISAVPEMMETLLSLQDYFKIHHPKSLLLIMINNVLKKAL